MATVDEVKGLVAQMPDPDQRGMYCENIDKAKIDAAIESLRRGGPEFWRALTELIVPPGEGDDVKARYALHALAVAVCKPAGRESRRAFGETLASLLQSDRPKAVKTYLCQQLQTAGGDEALDALAGLLTDTELCEPAAMAMTAIGRAAGRLFLAAWPKAVGPCRLTILQNLAVLHVDEAKPIFLAALTDGDREIRLAAGYGLMKLADPDAVEPLLKAAETDGWERIQATKHCLVLAEKLAAAGKKQPARRIYEHLKTSRTDPKDAYIRQAAETALATL